MTRKSTHHYPPATPSFQTRKSQILDAITVPAETYTDKSPKGSIDTPIVPLIQQINAIDGLVTTSSCSGRVAVFVEGPRTDIAGMGEGDGDGDEDEGGEDAVRDGEVEVKALTGSPGGKGGGHWLFVSHDPISIPSPLPSNYYMDLCGLSAPNFTNTSTSPSPPSPRLIKLLFSPLILHIHCSSLSHARSVLSASINAGFRESGVHSLKVLDDEAVGVMVGIRTMGLGFETVVGIVRDDGGGERYEAVVGEEFLRMVFGIVEERFVWNERRRDRLAGEIERVFGVGGKLLGTGEGGGEWEDKDVRRKRLREEGLRRKKEKEKKLQMTQAGGSGGVEGNDTDAGNANEKEKEAVELSDMFGENLNLQSAES